MVVSESVGVDSAAANTKGRGSYSKHYTRNEKQREIYVVFPFQSKKQCFTFLCSTFPGVFFIYMFSKISLAGTKNEKIKGKVSLQFIASVTLLFRVTFHSMDF